MIQQSLSFIQFKTTIQKDSTIYNNQNVETA